MTVVEALIELQEVDGRIREMEAELKDLPNRKAKEKARLTGVKDDLLAATERVESVNRTVRDHEANAEDLESKINELKIKQANADSNREYQQYSQQIDNISNQRDAAENNQIAALDNLPSAQDGVSKAQAIYDAQKADVDVYCSEIDERIKAVEEELAQAREERRAKANAVGNKKFLLVYERLRTRRWPVVVPLTHQGVCDGCHLQQPPSVSQLVDKNERVTSGEVAGEEGIVSCTMCGRILYRG